MDEKFKKAMDEFILTRINDWEESDNLTEVMAKFLEAAARLKASPSDDQLRLFTACENAFDQVTGEIRYHYYRAGFADAVLFLIGIGRE